MNTGVVYGACTEDQYIYIYVLGIININSGSSYHNNTFSTPNCGMARGDRGSVKLNGSVAKSSIDT